MEDSGVIYTGESNQGHELSQEKGQFGCQVGFNKEIHDTCRLKCAFV